MRHVNYTNEPKASALFYDSKRIQRGLNFQQFLVSLNIVLTGCLAIPLILVVSTGNDIWWQMSKLAPPLQVWLIFMYARYGSMTNWWAMMTGYDVKVNRDKISDQERQGESAEAIRHSIAHWADNCAKGRWVIVNPYRYRFLRKGDAAFFKLAWG